MRDVRTVAVLLWVLALSSGCGGSSGSSGSNGAAPVVVISNMTPVPRDKYRVPMPKAGKWSERVNTDAGWYGGGNTGNQGKVVAHSQEGNGWMPAYADLYLPSLATLILKYDPD